MLEDTRGPVFPVVPSYKRSGELDLKYIHSYLSFLQSNGAKSVMTTSGTTQFNLLTNDEILELNACVAKSFSGRVILGMPTLPERELSHLIRVTVERSPSASILITFPERFYSDLGLLRFFSRIADLAPRTSFYLHGLPIRRGNGGSLDYSARLLLKLIDLAPNIIGMKEECSSYELGFKLCSELPTNKNFEFVVAGGSMRRFLLLQAGGAQSFLSGIGSLFPQVETMFYEAWRRGDLHSANYLIREFETPLFRVFMDIGWHPALRRGLQLLGYASAYERRPMTGLGSRPKADVDNVVQSLQEKLNSITLKDKK